MKKYISLIIIFVLVVGIVTLSVAYANLNESKEYQQKSIDTFFHGRLSLLHNNLAKDCTHEDFNLSYHNAQNTEYARTAFSLISITSYSDNEYLYKILHNLYNWSVDEVLYERASIEFLSDFGRLLLNLDDEELSKEFYNKYILD